jgi:hypothetical protein
LNRLIDLPDADGHAGQIGDIDGGGYGDLVTGISDGDSLMSATGAAHRGGEIQVLHGSEQGLVAGVRRARRAPANPAGTSSGVLCNIGDAASSNECPKAFFSQETLSFRRLVQVGALS